MNHPGLLRAGVLVAVVAGLVTGCMTQNAYTGEKQVSKTTKGAAIGALAGAAVGALTGGDSKAHRKNALIGALYAYEMSLYMQAVSRAAHHEGTPPEKLHKFIQFVEITFREQEALVKLMPELIMYIAQNPSLMEMEKTITSTTLNLLQGIIEEGIRDGYFRQLDASAAATTILGAASGVLLQSYFNPELSLKLSLEYLSEFIMRGLNND